VLGFVTAGSRGGCRPSWGAAYTLAQADQALALSSRIAQVQQDGQQPIVSFGGQAHTSLDVACTSVSQLTAAYQAVISKYQLSTIDLDVEGAALTDFGAEERRAAAMASREQAAPVTPAQPSVTQTAATQPASSSTPATP
jgi:chitinase